MPLLNTASKIYQGSSLATKVYQGSVQVWPPAPSFGPDQSVYTDQTPVVSAPAGGSGESYGADIVCAVAGRIIALRHYRRSDFPAGQTTQTMRLWDNSGAQLASVSTVGESGSGWKVATISSPIIVTAGQTVRVSKDAPPGHTLSAGGAGTLINGDLSLTQNYVGIGGGGIIRPNLNDGSRYFVDLIFQKAL
jgi:Domain of unknown function (DUF4082)